MGVEPSGRAQEAMTAALDLARRFVSRYYPDVEAALLAGSRMRGEATSGSDYDVVLLFRALPEGAWRAMSLFEGRHIEMFAHDLATLAYFCREVDRPSGMAALPTMIAEGVALVTRSPTTLEAQDRLLTRRCASGRPSSTKPPSGHDGTPSQISPRRSMAATRRTYASPPGCALHCACRLRPARGQPMERLRQDASTDAQGNGRGSRLTVRGGIFVVVRHRQCRSRGGTGRCRSRTLRGATARGVPSRGAGRMANDLRPFAVMDRETSAAQLSRPLLGGDWRYFEGGRALLDHVL